MIDLLKSVYTELTAVTSEVYDEEVPDSEEATYPLLVVNFSSAGTDNMESTREDFILTIDGYDNKNYDATRLEALMSSVHTALNRLLKNDASNNDVNYKIYKDEPYRLRIPDPDPNIKRRQLRYLVQTYFS